MKLFYKIGFVISIALATASLIIVAIFGLRFGTDFTGGSVLEVEFSQTRPSYDDAVSIAEEASSVGSYTTSLTGDKGMIFRFGSLTEDQHQQFLNLLRKDFGEIKELRFDSVGPTVGRELRAKSLIAIVVLLIAIVMYIAFVFRRLSGVLSPWVMGFAAIVALLHDLIIPAGVFALLGYFKDVEISAVFVAAALTILGYSIADTVVIFDRVRENVLKFGRRQDFAQLVHDSIKQTLTRSLNTTLATLLSLLAIYFFGGESIRYFALALIMGITFGAYSSIVVASPILIWFNHHSN